MSEQKYKYIKTNSILYDSNDEYNLDQKEIYSIYSFFVIYSLCNNISFKQRTFVDYGWESNKINQIKIELKKTIDFDNENFIFTDKDNLKENFERCNLMDGALNNVDNERFVIGKTKENNSYLKLFYRIRNCFAHGKFILRYTTNNEKVVVMQDDDKYNVTARIVLKLETILNIINVIDRNKLITSEKKLVKE